MRRVLLIVFLMLAGAGLAGDIYKWSDDSGQTVFGDRPPAGRPAQAVVLPPEPPKAVLDAAQEALARDRAARTRLDVWGTIVVKVTSVADARTARPPFAIRLLLETKPHAPLERITIHDPHERWETRDGPNEHVAVSEQNFRLSLVPGEYRVADLELEAADLSPKPIPLLLSMQFNVPTGQCLYVGRMTFTILRLPPESIDASTARIGNIAEHFKMPIIMNYSPRGAMIPFAITVDQPAASEPRWGLSGAGWAFDEALARGCQIAARITTGGSPLP